MDLQMPETDGITATKKIRELLYPNAKTIPIIAITANVFQDDINACHQAGMNGHLSKPLNVEETISLLKKYL
jgi:CheY-like chemotaxis protein